MLGPPRSQSSRSGPGPEGGWEISERAKFVVCVGGVLRELDRAGVLDLVLLEGCSGFGSCGFLAGVLDLLQVEELGLACGIPCRIEPDVSLAALPCETPI